MKKPRYLYPRINLDISFDNLRFSLFSFVYKAKQEDPRFFQKIYQHNKRILVTLSVRTAFDALLQALKLPQGSEIIMSAINIPGMVEIAKLHGLVPVPVDIYIDTLEPSLNLLEEKISQKTKLILIAHLYGTTLNLDSIIEIALKHNILVIEDCAQAFCGDKYFGHPRADITLFSFGPIKSCTALGGALACIRNYELAEKVTNILVNYPTKSDFWFFKRVIKYTVLKLLTTPKNYFYLTSVLKLLGFDIDLVIGSLLRNFPKGEIFKTIRYLPPPSLLYLLFYRLNSYNNNFFEERTTRTRFFLSLLDNEIRYPGIQAINHSFWLAPIFVSDPKLIINVLRNNGFDATQGKTSLIHINKNSSTDFLYTNGEKFLTPDHLSQQTLYLPISEYLSKSALTNMAQLIKETHLRFNCKCSCSDPQTETVRPAIKRDLDPDCRATENGKEPE